MLKRSSLALVAFVLAACPKNPETQTPLCSSDSDCGAGYCLNGQCAECRVASDCAADLTCDAGQCVAMSECPCEEGLVCEGDRCVPQDPESIAASDERAIPSECQAIAGGLEEVALQAIQFDFDASTITPEAQQILAANARCLEYLPASTVVIEGHCDERGTSEYNLALGDARATAVAKYLALLGVASARLRPLTKGENEPLCNDSTEACWTKNRRAQLVTSSK